MIASRPRNAAPANRPMPTPPALTLTLSSDLASAISSAHQAGDVAARVSDELADRRVVLARDVGTGASRVRRSRGSSCLLGALRLAGPNRPALCEGGRVSETAELDRTYADEDWYAEDLTGRRFVGCTFRDVDLTESTARGGGVRVLHVRGVPVQRGDADVGGLRRLRPATYVVLRRHPAGLQARRLGVRRLHAAAAHRHRRAVARCHDARRPADRARPLRDLDDRGRPGGRRPQRERAGRLRPLARRAPRREPARHRPARRHAAPTSTWSTRRCTAHGWTWPAPCCSPSSTARSWT